MKKISQNLKNLYKFKNFYKLKKKKLEKNSNKFLKYQIKEKIT